jgi:hypothetical protein
MDDALCMSCGQSVRHLDRITESIMELQATGSDFFSERFAFHVLHDDEVKAFMFRNIENGDDIGMVECRRRARFEP